MECQAVCPIWEGIIRGRGLTNTVHMLSLHLVVGCRPLVNPTPAVALERKTMYKNMHSPPVVSGADMNHYYGNVIDCNTIGTGKGNTLG